MEPKSGSKFIAKVVLRRAKPELKLQVKVPAKSPIRPKISKADPLKVLKKPRPLVPPGEADTPSGPPRGQAVETLLAFEKQSQNPRSIAEAIDEQEGFGPKAATSGAAKAWYRDVVAGTLRHSHLLDELLKRLCERMPKSMVKVALKLGLYQLLFQAKTDPKDVVFETVEFLKKAADSKAANFANAVLRRFIREPQDLSKLGLTLDRRWSVPKWLVERLVAHYGEDWTEKFLAASSSRPKTFVRARKTVAPKVLETYKIIPLEVENAYEVQGQRNLLALLEKQARDFIVQDVSNQALVTRAALVFGAYGIEEVLDLCAAPGGKSIALAWAGFKVHAFEMKIDRRVRLVQNCERVGLSDEIKILSEDPLSLDHSWDSIWVDAPCSSSGLIGRHPDIRDKLENFKIELNSLVALQLELLTKATSKLRSGGLCVYSVCSVLPEEGPLQIQNLLTQNPKLALLEQHTFSPHEKPHGDGFFFAILKKT